VKTIMCAVFAACVAFAPLQAKASGLGVLVAGGIIGGLAGSIYQSGAAATAGSASKIASLCPGRTPPAAVVPAAATGAAAAIAATSAPVLFGVAIGGATAYLLYALVN
jgi:hypothetical protein